ncbi:MAG: beta-ketoacyl-[acyl-carrier-protein] synthase family protein [Syntrophales bacterium]
MDRRVVITGIGMVTPLGAGKEAFGRALWRGEAGIGEVTGFSTAGLTSHLAAEVRAFAPRDFISVKNLRKMDRLSAMATASVRMAADDAGLRIDTANRDRIGIVMGTAFGNTEHKVLTARVLFTEGPAMVNPIHVPNTVMNAPAGHASIELGFRGVNTTINHQAVSGETAIAYGAMEVRRGAADVIFAGGGDILSPFFYEALTRFCALSPEGGGPEGARPFDCRRNGPVAGEGCGIVCLEAAETAAARGVAPYAEVTGWGLAASPTLPTAWPAEPRGLLLALRRALKAAGVGPERIDLVQAAANGGRDLDAMEAAAYGELFGGRGAGTLITSLKGAIGETFASGGIRAAALALSLREGICPPVVGLAEPLVPLPLAAGSAVHRPLDRALLSGASFGGTYACVVFEKAAPLA